jgi:hypothetical protein
MLLLDDSSPSAICIDKRLPASSHKLSRAMLSEWPRLEGRIRYEERSIHDVVLEPEDVVVSAHACGALTDAVLARAVAAGARVSVLPCCHDETTCATDGLEGWVDVALAIDVGRAHRLSAAGYDVHAQLVPASITPKNRLLLGEKKAT